MNLPEHFDWREYVLNHDFLFNTLLDLGVVGPILKDAKPTNRQEVGILRLCLIHLNSSNK